MILLPALFLLAVFATAQGQVNSYLVLVPRNIKPGVDLKIPVHFINGPATMTSLTALLVDSKNNTLSSATYSNIVASDHIMELPIPQNISWGRYRVNVTGEGTVPFRNSTSVSGSPRSQVIFIQTDKAMYKPGEKVNYRAFAVNASLQLTPSIIDLEFFDPKGNKIAESMGQDNLQAGGISGELPLSDMPPLGSWRISAQVTGVENTREDYRFEVKEYVLPKFEVTVELPSFGRESDMSLTGTAKAMYTFGKPVQGNLILTVKKRYPGGFHDPSAIRTEMQINGEASFEIPMTVLERLTRNLEYETLLVIANVTESVTGITLQGQGEIRYHRNPYKIEFFPNMPENFKPGFGNYPVLLKVTQQDGRPPATTGENVEVTVTYFTDKRVTGAPANDTIILPNYDVVSPFFEGDTIMKTTKTYPIGIDGTVQFEIPIPVDTATFSIKAKYGELDTYKDVRRFRSPSEAYVKAKMTNPDPLKIGDVATITLSSNVNPSKVYYAILSKGAVVETRTITGLAGTLSLPVTREMAPTARFVVYFVQPDGEIVADGFNFVIEDIFENKVTIQFDQTKVEPKTAVNLVVTADEGSMVNVLAVDKSVILLADGNDITPRRVEDQLGRLGDSPWIVRGWGRIFPWSFGADDVTDIFNEAQLIVLTDANLYSFDLWSLRQKYSALGERGGAPRMMSSAFAGNDMQSVSSGGGPQGQIRRDFPETWMWKSAVASNLREAKFPDIAPDTITDFVANAFAIHPETGLGVAPITSNLTVFLPFFVNLQVPYSIVRGETAVIQANVFNYRDTEHYVIVRLKESPDYDIISIAGDGTETVVTGDSQLCILVKPGAPVPAYFNIRAKKIGTTNLNVRASVPPPVNIFDEVIRPLPIKAEGIEKEKNQAVLVSLQTQGSVQETRDITYPTTGLVQDSQKIRVTVIGDLFGPSLENLENLIRLPYGCGEQNMVNFAPSVFAAVYMKNTGRFDTNQELQDKIKNTLTTGIQRQMIYQRNDGSFSSFGDADDEGSLWLTSFVAKSFAQAKKLMIVYIDPKVVDRAVRYIVDNQTPDGNFVNTGISSQKYMTGASAQTNRSLTAFTLIALRMVKQAEIIVDPETSRRLNDAIVNAQGYLDAQVPLMTSAYEMAISLYALQLGGPYCPSCETLVTMLDNHASKMVEGNSKHWMDSSKAIMIEQTSYILLAYTLREDRNNGVQILSWLVKQRNTRGGFSSTQDTVVALQALSEFASLIYSMNVNLVVTITTKTGGISGTPVTITLNNNNHDILQYRDIDGSVDQVAITATGVGLALIDINQYYNIKQEEVPPSYIIQVSTFEETATSHKVRVCATFNIPNSRSNMAILDIGVVSGFEPQKDQVVMSPLMKRIELVSGRLVTYFDEIPSTETCVEVPVQRVAFVAGVKPASVVVYSYYEPTERAMVEYLPSNLQTATVCSTCPTCCDASTYASRSLCGLY